MRRIILAPLLVLALMAATAGVVSADPWLNPGMGIYSVDCPSGSYEVLSKGVPGHVIGDTSIGILLGGNIELRVNGEVVSTGLFRTVPGHGLAPESCTIYTSWTDGGDFWEFFMNDARIFWTPPSG